MGLSCLFIGYGLFFISDRFEFFPFATVFKPLDIICDEVFPYGYGIGGFLCPALVLFCFSAYVFQQTLTVKIIPDFLISLFLVAFECKTIISMCFLYNHPCSFFLGIHGIRSNDAFPAAKFLQAACISGISFVFPSIPVLDKQTPHSVDMTLNSSRLHKSSSFFACFFAVCRVSFPSAAMMSRT